MSLPLVSIGFPVYNGEALLRRAMDSVLSQDFEDFELIVCDNASTDGTEAICREYAGQDRRVRFFRNQTNIGASPNHNRVFELSRGKYFAWMAHDVEQLPGMLSRCVREMELNALNAPPVVLAYPRCEQIDEHGRPIDDGLPTIAMHDPRPHRRMGAVIKRINYVTQHYGLFAAEALRRTRLNGSYPSSDYVLTAEMAMLGEIVEIPEVLIRRRHESHHGTRAVLHDKQAWVTWLDPKMKGHRLVLRVEERLALEYMRSAWALPLRPLDKLTCAVTGPLVHYQRIIPTTIRVWRSRLGELRHHLVG